ncbi:MAG: hypothetical protein K2G40_07030 [Muribaculaceae bacterium]|nr:hypothetical protein [Muribaculaceae bacterium]
MIDHLIRSSKCVGLVIIDGIRDLMLDINSPLEATQIVNYLMKWIEELRFWPYKPDVSDCDTPG